MVHFWSKTRGGLTNGRGVPLGENFLSFWSGAFPASMGATGKIYDLAAFHSFQRSLVGADLQLYNYSHPPTFLLLTWPLAWLPYVAAWVAWSLGGVAAFVAATRAVWRSGHAVLYALAVPATFVNLMEGQNGRWTAALMAGFLVNLERRPLLAGVLVGVLVCKPQLALLVPVALIAGRHWKALVGMAISSAGPLLASLGLFGPDLWAAYLDHAVYMRREVLENGPIWPWMPSAFIMVRNLPTPVATAYAVQALVSLGTAATVVVVWRGRASPGIKAATLVLCSLLAPPWVQHYDLAMAAFVPCWLACDLMPSDPRRGGLLAACSLLVLGPILVPAVAWGTGIAFGWLRSVPALWISFSMRPTAALPPA